MFRNIFVFEDRWKDRKPILTRGFSNDTQFHVAPTFNDAMKLLDAGIEFDAFFLDHDISFLKQECRSENHDHEWDCCPDCVVIDKSGHDLAKLIVRLGIGKGKIFLVHSDNPPGARNIALTLDCDGRIVRAISTRTIRQFYPNLQYTLSQVQNGEHP